MRGSRVIPARSVEMVVPLARGLERRRQRTSVRVDAATHRELKRLASSTGSGVGDTVALAVRRLRQDRIAEELRAELTPEEKTWLDADLG